MYYGRKEEKSMDSLVLGMKVILPLIVFMGLGYLFRRAGLAGEQSFREWNKICFRCFLPVMIFFNIYQSNLRADFDGKVLVFAIAAVFCVFLSSVFLVNRLFPGSKNRSVVIQGIYRSNFVLFGMEVTKTICGENQMGMASILVAVIIPMFNVLAVCLFEWYGSEKRNRRDILKGILKNPLILASVFGILAKAAHLQLPKLAENIVRSVSQIATPVALLCLGGTFAFSKISAYRKELILSCLGRLAIVPLIFVTAAVLLGFRGSSLTALMVMLASPAAVSSYTMACEMKGNGELAGMIVVFTSVISVATIFLWVLVLNSLGLLQAAWD